MTRALLALSAALLTAAALPAQQPTPAPRPAPAPKQTPNPHYAVVHLQIDVDAPVEKTWARIGKYCDIGEWGIPGCTILSGDGDFGTVRSIADEILVAKTQYSYTYAQPVRVGVPYNMYHGTLEARAVTPTTSRLFYTLLFDNSALADDAAREKDIANRTTRFNGFLKNMKTLAEGGTVAPASLAAPPVIPSATK